MSGEFVFPEKLDEVEVPAITSTDLAEIISDYHFSETEIIKHIIAKLFEVDVEEAAELFDTLRQEGKHYEQHGRFLPNFDTMCMSQNR